MNRTAERLRVLLMSSSMRGGGSERQVLMLSRMLDRSRFEPMLYLMEREGDLLCEVPDDVRIFSDQECPKAKGIYFPGRVLRHQTNFLKTLIRQNKIDVIYDRTFHMTMIAGPAAKRCGVPRISTIVSPPHLALPMVERRFVRLKRRRLTRAYRNAARVIAVSQQAATSALKYYGLSESKVEVIHNPVDRKSLQACATQTPKNDEVKHIVCVGRMTEEKGHQDLLHAIARVQPEGTPFVVDLIGDGPLRPQLELLASSLSIEHAVRFLGANPNAAPAIASADALVLPSRFEGLPNVVLEAMALGTPVIATKAGGTIELEREEPTAFWAETADPKSLAKAIDRFLREQENANRQSAAALKLVETHHDLENATKRLEEILIDSSGRPSR